MAPRAGASCRNRSLRRITTPRARLRAGFDNHKDTWTWARLNRTHSPADCPAAMVFDAKLTVTGTWGGCSSADPPSPAPIWTWNGADGAQL